MTFLLHEPDNEVYRLAKSGTLALLEAVDGADTKGAAAKASNDRPCEAVKAYLEAAFLGSFLRSGQEIPYAANAGVLGTYIDFLVRDLARGALHPTPALLTHLKLLAYVTAIEAEAPLALFGNALGFLARTRTAFDFGIYYDKPSANKKLEAVNGVSKTLERIGKVPKQFAELRKRLGTLIDPGFRNAIAHATYRVHSNEQRVDIWKKGKRERSWTFTEVDGVYLDARCYQAGFMAAVSEFADQIHPECPYAWHPP